LPLCTRSLLMMGCMRARNMYGKNALYIYIYNKNVSIGASAFPYSFRFPG
jgi:hypothetical protein